MRRSNSGVPPGLAGVLALAEGTSEPAGSFLAPGVQIWLASPDHGLTAGVEAATGAVASAEVPAQLSPSSLTVVAAVGSEGGCSAEVTRRVHVHADADARVAGGEPEARLAGDADARVAGGEPEARLAGAAPETCLVGLNHDSTGAVSRLIWLRAPLVPASHVDEDTRPPTDDRCSSGISPTS